jgi:hypothetical protein
VALRGGQSFSNHAETEGAHGPFHSEDSAAGAAPHLVRQDVEAFTLPATVHDEASCRVWQRRFYDMNIWTEKKQLEKLDYMHDNPVTRGLVGSPSDWPWSSWRFYFLEDKSIIAMDRMP